MTLSTAQELRTADSVICYLDSMGIWVNFSRSHREVQVKPQSHPILWATLAEFSLGKPYGRVSLQSSLTSITWAQLEALSHHPVISTFNILQERGWHYFGGLQAFSIAIDRFSPVDEISDVPLNFETPSREPSQTLLDWLRHYKVPRTRIRTHGLLTEYAFVWVSDLMSRT